MLSCGKILVTAGPTHEPIDPVRFIGNRSSGKMGYAIAEVLAEKGIEVILISGPVNLQIKNPKIRLISVTTAHEMFEVVKREFPDCDGGILSAAVADFTPAKPSSSKIKKGDTEDFVIHLNKTTDILAYLGKERRITQKLIGFSLETDHEIENAKKKLFSKNIDFIILNSLKEEGVGFGSDTNKISIIHRNGTITHYPVKSKHEVAKDIVDAFLMLFS